MNYVCGFLFHPQFKGVALIEKNKPEWQKGCLNGIGGKIEVMFGRPETPLEAMNREFFEETSVSIDRWKLIRVERFKNGAPDGDQVTNVHFFAAVARLSEWDSLKSTTDERVVRWLGSYDDPKMVYNLRYLLPMSQVLLGQPPEFFPEP